MKKLNKRLLAGLTALLLAALMSGTALAAGATTAAEARSGVARVVMLYDVDLYALTDGAYVVTLNGYSSGSAFGVGTAGEETDVFVTNRHVVTTEDGQVTLGGTDYYAVYTATGYYILLDDYAYNSNTFTIDTSRSVPCTVVYLGGSEDADVAVLRAAEKVPGRVALALQGDEGTLEVGDAVSALGYPGVSDGATSEGYLLAAVDDVTVTGGMVSRFYESVSVTASSDGLTGRLIQSTAPINGGNSGGPLIDENGTVVGINTYTYSSTNSAVTNTYYALRVQYAKDALDSLNIPYDVYTGSNGSGAVIAVVLIAAAVAAVAVVLIVRKRGGPAKKAPAPAIQGTSPLGEAVPAAAPVSIPDPADSGFRIQGVAGALEGKRFLIGTQSPVILGRSPEQCGVVFPAGTPGVSARHCAVWAEGGHVYIKDLGSTHGTFLSPGRRLAAEQAVQLAPGDVFFLGSEAQSLVIAERRPR